MGSNWAIFNALVIDAYPVPQSGTAARMAINESDISAGNDLIEVTFGQLDNQTISIYPIPFETTLKIDYKQKGLIKVDIFDLNGRRIIQKEFQNDGISTREIDLTGLKDQIYLLQMSNDHGVIKNIKLYKK